MPEISAFIEGTFNFLDSNECTMKAHTRGMLRGSGGHAKRIQNARKNHQAESYIFTVEGARPFLIYFAAVSIRETKGASWASPGSAKEKLVLAARWAMRLGTDLGTPEI